jgi:hypothetical protein
VHALRLDAGAGFQEEFVLRFYSLPRPTPSPDHDPREILTHWKNPVANRAPVEVITRDTGIRELNREPVISIHSPGSVVWDLQPDDRQLLFTYGMMPHTYLDGGQTDGVEFSVEAIPPGQAPRQLWRRHLRPFNAEPDRGLHDVRVPLPSELPAGSRLAIRVNPGPAGNEGWDQAYLTRIQFTPQVANQARYFGFNVSPLPPGFAPKTEYEYEGRPVRGVHPPFELRFDIPAGARHVVAGIGIMAGAYQEGNQTDGVGFSFAVLRPDGRTETLGYRLLDPFRQPQDRGVQSLEFNLPTLPPGAVLIVRTDAGPKGNLAWDWAFLQTIVIE